METHDNVLSNIFVLIDVQVVLVEKVFYFISINDEDFCVFLSVVRFCTSGKGAVVTVI